MKFVGFFMIKTVFLDLDDTLLDFHRAERVALSDTLTQFGVKPTEAIIKRYSEINRFVWEQLELGKMTRAQILVLRFELLFEELGLSVDGMEARQAYEWNLGCHHFYIDGAEAVLAELEAKYDLYLMSNGTAAVQDRRIEASGIAKYFKGIFISEKVGYNKPSIEFFEKCFAEMPNFKKEESIIVGDSLSSDIQGGINAGILTCHYNPKGEKKDGIAPNYTISALEELPALLQRL